MYFDCVLDKNMVPKFNGNPDETRAWLQANDTELTDRVCYGKTMKRVTVAEYLAKK